MSQSFQIALGDPLPLSFAMPAGASGLFPRARIYDSSDVEVAGSPFDLTEVGATARYTGASFTPLAVGTFTARFVAFTDAGHTTEAVRFSRDQDAFVVGITDDDLVDLVWDELNRGADHNIKDSTGKQQRQASGGVDTEDVVAATATTITLAATESAIDDFIVRRHIAIVDGLGGGQIRVISAYDGTTKIATVSRAWDVVPDVTSDYLLLLSTEVDLVGVSEDRLRYVHKWIGGVGSQPVTHTTAIVGTPGSTTTPDSEVDQVVDQTDANTTVVTQS